MNRVSVAVCSQAPKARIPTIASSAIAQDSSLSEDMANPIEQAIDEFVTAAAVEADFAVAKGQAAGAAGFPPKPPPAAPPKASGMPAKAQPPQQAASWGSAEDQWMG